MRIPAELMNTVTVLDTRHEFETLKTHEWVAGRGMFTWSYSCLKIQDYFMINERAPYYRRSF